jgi:hypothetical protein
MSIPRIGTIWSITLSNILSSPSRRQHRLRCFDGKRREELLLDALRRMNSR